jgi:hypothetical protein
MKLWNHLRQGLSQKTTMTVPAGSLEGLTVNPQVPGSNPGRGAKNQMLRPQKCGLFVVFVRRILDVSKMAGKMDEKKEVASSYINMSWPPLFTCPRAAYPIQSMLILPPRRRRAGNRTCRRNR